MPKCPDCDYEGSVKGLGSHRKAHRGEKEKCPHCRGSRRFRDLSRHVRDVHPETLEPEVGEELSFETWEHWQRLEELEALVAAIPAIEEARDQALEDSKRRLRNDKRFRRLLKQHGIPVPKDLEKQ